MRYDNEVGERALGMYANHEHVVVAQDLFTEIINQIIGDAAKDDLDEVEVDDHAVAGLMLLVMNVCNSNGYLRLEKDIQDLAVKYGIASRI